MATLFGNRGIWLVLVIFRWLYMQLVEAPVRWLLYTAIDTSEESFKSYIREVFIFMTRFINGAAAVVVSVFVDHTFWIRRQGKGKTRRKSEVWKGLLSGNHGTFNALLEQAELIPNRDKSNVDDFSANAIGRRRRKKKHSSLDQKKNSLPRRGSDLFDRPSGYAIAERCSQQGLIEIIRIWLELRIEIFFDNLRHFAMRLLFLHPNNTNASKSGEISRDRITINKDNKVFSSAIDCNTAWTASEAILHAGFPLEEQIVTTSDGYVLTMQRIPRKDSREVVFFQHGIMDTSLGWVANGVDGSQALAAYENGADVWLGSSRSNPPHLHANKDLNVRGQYWHFTINELGMEDISAQIDWIHKVKCAELSSGLHGNARSAGIVGGSINTVGKEDRIAKDLAIVSEDKTKNKPTYHKRSGSDSALSAAHQVNLATGAIMTMKPPNEESIRDYHHNQNMYQVPSNSEEQDYRKRNILLSLFNQFAIIILGKKRCKARDISSLSFQHDVSPENYKERFSTKQIDQVIECCDDQNGYFEHEPSLDDGLRIRRSQTFSFSPIFARNHSSVSGTDICAADKNEVTCHGTGISNRGDMTADGFVSLLLQESHTESQEKIASNARGAGEDRDLQVEKCTTDPSVDSEFEFNARNEKLSDIDPMMTPDRFSSGGIERLPSEIYSFRTNAANYFHETAGKGNFDQNSIYGWSGEKLRRIRKHKPIIGKDNVESSNTNFQPDPRRFEVHIPDSGSETELYRLQAVGHSLGSASLLIYAVLCRLVGRPHRLSKLVLLTPAGFHRTPPKVAWPFMYAVPALVKLLRWIRPGMGTAARIPSPLLRYVAFKLTVDLHQIPALNELTRAALRLLMNGDASEWDRALQMPHYNEASMPAISLHTGDHLMQLIKAQRFLLYDYGSPEANMQHYGKPEPLEIPQYYHLLQGLPIDLVAGRSDGVVPAEDVLLHYESMQRAGLNVSYKEMDLGHLDLTFAVKNEVQLYLLRRLGLDTAEGSQRRH